MYASIEVIRKIMNLFMSSLRLRIASSMVHTPTFLLVYTTKLIQSARSPATLKYHLYSPYSMSVSDVANETVARPSATRMSGDKQHSEAMSTGIPENLKSSEYLIFICICLLCPNKRHN